MFMKKRQNKYVKNEVKKLNYAHNCQIDVASL